MITLIYLVGVISSIFLLLYEDLKYQKKIKVLDLIFALGLSIFSWITLIGNLIGSLIFKYGDIVIYEKKDNSI